MRRALSIMGLTLTIALLGVLLLEPLFIDPSALHWINDPSTALGFIGLVLGLGIVGALLSWYRPDQSIGWLMLLGAVSFAARVVLEELTIVSSREGIALASVWLAFLTKLMVAVGLPLLATVMVVFPSGRPSGPRWRAAIAVIWTTVCLSIVLAPFSAYWIEPLGILVPPLLGQEGKPDLEPFIGFPSQLVMIAAGARIVALAFQGTRIERHQVKWLSYTLAVVGALLLLEPWFPVSANVATIVAAVGIPSSIAIAVTRYRLYDIDVIISRSVSFGVLTILIGAVYVGIVVGVGNLLGDGEGSSFGLSVVATAVVAIGFQPVRLRIEHWANRAVYGKRATPYEVLAQFSYRATEESDEDVLARIPQLIVEGTGASNTVVWVRSKSGFRSASAWPNERVVRTLDGTADFRDPEADVSFPVFHDGDLLGGISMVAARGVEMTRSEHELVQNLADGLGLTLRNAQLTATLRRQVKSLQRSRDRIVSAADEARRSLEHDLDSGPQQHLVAVKVKLGPLRKLAEQAGAARTAEVLADIESQAGEAIQAVRDFAAGIYPPLLGAEGLVVALGQETRKAALPVELEADNVGRYPRDIESAVYFSILEAVQNTAKYAEATRAVVRLSESNGDLLFEVSDDGKGFDLGAVVRGAGLNGIGDRIDTVGGTWTIDSSVGEGTTVKGVIPVGSDLPV